MLDCREDTATQATLSFKSPYGAYLRLGSGVYGVMPATQLETAFRGDTDLEKTPQTVDLTRGNRSWVFGQASLSDRVRG